MRQFGDKVDTFYDDMRGELIFDQMRYEGSKCQHRPVWSNTDLQTTNVIIE